jgi:hypothetical protein
VTPEAAITVSPVPHPAAEIVRDAVEALDGVLTVPDAARVWPDGLDRFPADALNSALSLLAEAQGHLTANVETRMAAVVDAMACVRKAIDAIESTRGFVRWMPPEVVGARADALRLLDQVTSRW